MQLICLLNCLLLPLSGTNFVGTAVLYALSGTEEIINLYWWWENYANTFLCNSTHQKKQGLSGRQRVWPALNAMLQTRTVKSPSPAPPSSSWTLHWKICSPARHGGEKGSWHLKIILLPKQAFCSNHGT